jgi:predicted metal-dependent peptidase
MHALTTRLSVQRWKLLEAEPFLGYLALELPSYVLKSTGDPKETAFTNFTSYSFYDDFCSKLTDPMLLYVVCHEIGHVALGHDERRGGRDPKKWNYACDFVLNGIIENCIGRHSSSPIAIAPPKVCYDPAFAGMTEEQVYELLPEEYSSTYQSGQDDADGEGGDGKGKDGKGGDSPVELPELLDPLTHTDQPKSAKEASEQKAQVQQSIARAVHKAKEYRRKMEAMGHGQGMAPGLFERLAASNFIPTEAWHAALRRILSGRGRAGTDWGRPNKKTAYLRINGRRVILPSRKSFSFGHIACVFDTSGSISDEELSQFISEINNLLSRSANTTVHLYSTDTQMHHLGTLRSPHKIPADFKPIGGGGTDFNAAFSELERLHRRVKLNQVVFFSDTFASFSPKRPAYPLIWLVPDFYKDQAEVPYGQIIFMPITPRHLKADATA